MIVRAEELNNGYLLQLVYVGLEYGQGGRGGTAIQKARVCRRLP